MDGFAVDVDGVEYKNSHDLEKAKEKCIQITRKGGQCSGIVRNAEDSQFILKKGELFISNDADNTAAETWKIINSNACVYKPVERNQSTKISDGGCSNSDASTLYLNTKSFILRHECAEICADDPQCVGFLHQLNYDDQEPANPSFLCRTMSENCIEDTTDNHADNPTLAYYSVMDTTSGSPGKTNHNWLNKISSQYLFVSTAKNWIDAKTHCESIGRKLAVARNAEEAAIISHLGGSSGAWIGLTDQNSEGSWKDSIGGDQTYFAWKSAEPSGGITENCVDLQIDGWSDKQCSLEKPFVCERREAKYVLVPMKKTFDDAKEFCKGMGRSLAVPRNDAEQRAMINLRTSTTLLGITDSGSEGLWKDIHDEPVRYTKWSENEPNGGKIENCAILTTDELLWIDVACSNEYSFICESTSPGIWGAPKKCDTQGYNQCGPTIGADCDKNGPNPCCNTNIGMCGHTSGFCVGAGRYDFRLGDIPYKAQNSDCYSFCGKGGSCDSCNGWCCSPTQMDQNGDCPQAAIQQLETTKQNR